jgi:hypothetical protein
MPGPPAGKLLTLAEGGHVSLFTQLDVVREQVESLLTRLIALRNRHRIEDRHEGNIAQI